MRFLVLGPIDVESDASEMGKLTAPQVRKLLALMIIHHDEVLPAAEIGELLWPGRAAHRQSSALRFHMWKLRNALEPSRPSRSTGSLIAQTGSGYVLRLAAHSLDAMQFEAALDSARLDATDQPDAAIQVLTAAAGLWRGSPFSDVIYEDFAQAEIRRLTALRYEADVLRMDLFLRIGRFEQAAAELESLTVLHPLSERMWNQLMAALIRSGRVGEAVRARERAHAAFADELGVRPPASLLELEEHVLHRA